MGILGDMSVVVVGFLPLIVSCAQSGLDEGGEEVGVAVQAGGGGTHNGCDPERYQACLARVVEATDMQLVVNGDLNPQLDGGLSAGEKCEEPLEYMYKCGGEAGTALPGPIPGGGLMDLQTDWRSDGLTSGEKVDVLTCMTTLLNPNAGVPICLEGAHVAGNGSCASYIVEEAVWLTVPNPTSGGVLHNVWSLLDGSACNPAILAEVLRQRVCGPDQTAQQCGLLLRNDFGTACQLQNGYYECDGLPAIETKLESGGFQLMYAGCLAPQ